VRSGRRGSVLVVSLIGTVVLALLGVTLAQIVCDEQQISANSTDSEEALYLAGAGLADVVWRVCHDSSWEMGFRNGSGWTAHINRTAASGLRPNRGYQVTVVGIDRGSALVTSTGIIARSGGFARRVITAHVAQGYVQPPQTAIYAVMASGWDTGTGDFENGNIEIAAKADITGGVLANNDLFVQTRSKKGVTVDTTPVIWQNGTWVQGTPKPFPDNVTELAVGHLDITQAPIVVDNQKIDVSHDGTAATFTMPALDFDYLRQEADHYYTGDELSNMLQAGPVTLTGVVFIEGDVQIPSSRALTVNGLLVASGNVELLGESSFLQVNRNPNADEWQNSGGIICRGNITLQGDYYVEGLVYSLDTIDLKGEKPGAVRRINGSLIARQVLIRGREGIAVTLDPQSRAWVEVVLQEAGLPSGETTTLRVDAWNEIY
jgi:Tfp pilus assembly protein PilX